MNTTNHTSFFRRDDAHGSCVVTEPLFTPVRRVWTTKLPIFIEKGISRESQIYLRYMIINQPILRSHIETNRNFGLGRAHYADRHLQDVRSRDHNENRPKNDRLGRPRTPRHDANKGLTSHPAITCALFISTRPCRHGQIPKIRERVGRHTMLTYIFVMEINQA